MKIATWNVNSLAVRLPHLLDWLAMAAPDVVCLQETKLEDARFPLREIRDAGYPHVLASGQKTYNGVALLARTPITDGVAGIPAFPDDQKRLVGATVGGVRVIGCYVPNGQAVGSEAFAYKLRWLEALRAWIALELARNPRLVVVGDFNVAPEPRDVHDPVAWEGHVLYSPAEREAFSRLLAIGLADAFRLFEQPDHAYSWWDYRMQAFRRNRGLRIDHILVSSALVPRVRACAIERALRALDRPSDHAPVVAEIDVRA
ncbi:MAG: exodeoxyribonuclease III [Betaproteobacteria bacterium]|nr:exodeoxyribonuclease III [Betaproteobacteria bacterium]